MHHPVLNIEKKIILRICKNGKVEPPQTVHATNLTSVIIKEPIMLNLENKNCDNSTSGKLLDWSDTWGIVWKVCVLLFWAFNKQNIKKAPCHQLHIRRSVMVWGRNRTSHNLKTWIKLKTNFSKHASKSTSECPSQVPVTDITEDQC